VSRERYERLREIVLAARAVAPAERAAHLDRACAGDAALRAEAEALLAHDRDLAPPLAAEALRESLASAWRREAGPEIPERIGPYRVLDVLGEGGMGMVYRAEQSEPIRREVALKVIRRGLDVERVVARFGAERQALARMEHPGIARVLDAGADDEGRPYFVMELVRGVPITRFCRERGLDLRARVALMLRVCEAVQHAHQRGIIHRDLKPSNVLVGELDGQAVPKVIDFGIAKAIAGAEGLDGLTTQHGVALGTPEYMSPEQAGVVRAEVDTRTDVWSLGVILHELLTGRRPFPMESPTPAEIVRVLSAEGPAVPSSLVEPRSRAVLRGDLDAILLRALRRDADERYASVADFAEDLRRWMALKPVEARRGAWSYRAGRFVRRHRIAVGLAAVAVVGLAGMAVVFAVQSQVVSRERDRAVAAERQARAESETARRVSDFLVHLFEQADPRTAPGGMPSARQVLDRGAERVRGELKEDPIVQARLMSAIGEAYLGIGLLGEAMSMSREALEIQRRALPPDHEETAALLGRLGTLSHDLGEFEEAERFDTAALEMYRRLHGGDHPDVATALAAVAGDKQVRGDLAGAAPLMREALEIHRRLLGAEHPEVAADLYMLGWLQHRQARWAEAESLYHAAAAIQRKAGESQNPDLGNTLNNLSGIRWELGDLSGAIAASRESFAIYRSMFGDEHVAVARGMGNLGRFLRGIGEYGEAETLLAESVRLLRASPAARPAYLAAMLETYGGLLHEIGRDAEARRLLDEALAIRGRLAGSRDAHSAIALRELGRLHVDRGELEAGERVLRKAVAEFRAKDPPGYPAFAIPLAALAEARAARGAYAEAESLLAEAIAIRVRTGPAAHPLTAAMRATLGEVRARRGRVAEGVALMRESVAQMEAGGLRRGQHALERARRKLAAFEGREPAARGR